MIERALVVESHFQARRKLAYDLSSFQIADSIIEAESVADGLTKLETHPFGVCLLGPELQANTIKNFLMQGRMRSLSPHCAFVRVKPDQAADPELDSLADRIIVNGYDGASLRRVVEEAAEDAIVSIGPKLARPSGTVYDRATTEQPATLPDTLQNLAIEMKSVARALTSGALHLNENGEPTDATLTALKRTLERAFPERNQHGELPIDVRAFLNLTVDFLKARVTGNEQQIAERLQKLL